MNELKLINETLNKQKEEKPKKITGKMVFKGYKAPKKPIKKKPKKNN